MAEAGQARQSVELRLEDISKRFGHVVAVENSSLTVEPGLLVSLLGPSGCGKTTTLRIIAGFEAPDTGRVVIGERDVSYLPPDKRGLGMVFQNYSLFPHMTVGENIAFGLKMRKVPKDDITRRVREMLDLVHLPGHEERFPNQLSGGQQQRVALARSLVTNPSILLLDEPLGALDKNLRENMQFELRRIQQTLGITTILVTHDQEEALTLSDRVVVMNKGQVLQVGSPKEVYEYPRTRFVSEFLGTSNLFEGELASGAGGEARFTVAGGAFDFRVPQPDGARAAGRMVAVRPEKMWLSDDPSAGQNAVAVQVIGHVFRGSYHAYEVQAAGRAEPIFVYAQARSREGERVYAIGSGVSLNWHVADSIVLAD